MICFGDNVRVRMTPLTEQMGIAGLTGNVHGETTPSVTGVDVIGELIDDFALHVEPENGEGFWIARGAKKIRRTTSTLEIRL